ncbi:hypothetical protein BF93_02490 [Brachybacterium phenoliresistens]|uniref:Uncharacterized protein n=1 Tax=Brachybacterium phenoliresistens TaxID=396014 RepID=Z9JR22_9MICO|nr:hypothetical protein BF93_02490 [Brachybacterium phenoliresistens]
MCITYRPHRRRPHPRGVICPAAGTGGGRSALRGSPAARRAAGAAPADITAAGFTTTGITAADVAAADITAAGAAAAGRAQRARRWRSSWM